MQSQFCSSSFRIWLTTLAVVMIILGVALAFAPRIP